MAHTKLIFYDIRTLVPGLPTSNNTWRVRLVLNYKNLPYETVWSEIPDIAATCIAAGIPPFETRADGSLRYTFPALVDLTNSEAPIRLTDSRKIIDYLETTYPSTDPKRALFPPESRGFQALADSYFDRIIHPFPSPLVTFQMTQKQTERARPLFEKYAPPGKTLAEANLKGREREEAWSKLREELDKLAAWAEGDIFFSGDNLRYFDIHLLAGLTSMRLSIGDEEFGKGLGPSAGGRWVKLVKACADLIR
ncbi:hypothetical protein ACEPAF_9567 [Sanghuangporus sanghuang]